LQKTLLCLERNLGRAKSRIAALQDAGYKVIAVDNVVDALKIFVSQTIDAVLVDDQYGTGKKESPGAAMTGIRPHVPIILICGDRAYVRRGLFAEIYKRRDGNPELLRILDNVFSNQGAEPYARSARSQN